MANTKSAKKRARQTPKRTTRNIRIKGSVKTALRAAREAITTEGSDLKAKLSKAMSVVSKAGNKGTFHKRTVARKISRLMRAASKAASAPAVVAVAKKPAKTTKKKTTKRTTKK